MVEKVDEISFDEKLIGQMGHRVNLLSITDKNVTESYDDQNDTIIEQKILFKERLTEIRTEITNLKETTHMLRKAVFLLGHKLKKNVNHRTVNAIKEKIDAWPLEEYITKKELPLLFEKYSKN